ncbi:MAG: ribonuclease Z [Candidatus Micrarchaeota archaeon]|nr:ribonuclease Z [Candidatus Micrarchaeota archaeon]MDE1847623.1 ribonuclease Z [Candidatus Micrarchaeota archaeon]MDE1863826.1 ribonuclease Z [Candidatus Micrarchaeota archaeon]
MIKITMLGTSGSTPTKERGLPAAAITYNGKVYLFDCGEGTQMKMLAHGVNISRVEAIFISHVHGDHIIGLAGLVRTMALNNRQKTLTIYVPKGEEKTIKNLIVFDRAIIDYPVEVKGTATGIIYRSEGFEVSAFRLNHQITTYGYLFKEKDRKKFIADKCRSLGIKGKMFREITQRGSITVGKKRISISSVTLPQKGKSVLYVTDTRPCASTEKAAKGADLLIHEAAYSDAQKALAVMRKHCTAGEAARLAKKAKVKMLLLTHISARYKDTDLLLSDATKIFKNTVVAKDGYTVEV